MSYTQFTYTDLTLSHNQVTPTDVVTVSVNIKNTGQRAGDEVVQLYVADPIASITRPVKALKGFKRLTLQPGEQKRYIFNSMFVIWPSMTVKCNISSSRGI